MKRIMSILLVLTLTLIAPVLLALPASATEDTPDWIGPNTFEVSSVQSSNNLQSLFIYANFKSVLYHAYYSQSAAIVGVSTSYLAGYYWDEYGALKYGLWSNPYSAVHASYMGVYSLSEITLVTSYDAAYSPVFFSAAVAQSYPSFATTNLYAIDWSVLETDWHFSVSCKSAADSTFSYTTRIKVKSQSLSSGFFPVVSGMSYSTFVAPNVPLVDTSFGGQVVYIAEDEFFNLFVDVEGINGKPSINWYMARMQEDGTWVSGELAYTGDLHEYNDGCYIGGWRYMPDADAAPYSVMFMAEVTNTIGELSATTQTDFVIVHVTSYDDSGGSGDSGSSGEDTETLGKLEELDTDIQEVQAAVNDLSDQVEELPNQIVDGMGELMDQEKAEAESTGQSSADEVLDMIPDDSQGFLDALSSLLDVLTYDGTEAVLVFPAITIPGIDGLFPEFTVLGEQLINFEEYVALLPKKWYNLSVAVLDIGFVLYCVKEFYGTIGGFFHGFGGAGKE